MKHNSMIVSDWNPTHMKTLVIYFDKIIGNSKIPNWVTCNLFAVLLYLSHFKEPKCFHQWSLSTTSAHFNPDQILDLLVNHFITRPVYSEAKYYKQQYLKQTNKQTNTVLKQHSKNW